METRLTQFLAKARGRSLRQRITDLAIAVLVAALGCSAIILLAGSEWVSWNWLVIVLIGGLGAAAYFARRGVLSTYQVAQKIDAQLGLADTLSTAEFFRQGTAQNLREEEALGGVDRTIQEGQRIRAENLAENIDIKKAMPFQQPRALYAAVALGLVVGGLLVVRYAVLGTLDLRTSLVKNAFNNFFQGPIVPPTPNSAKQKDPASTTNNPEEQAEQENSDFAGDPEAPDPLTQTAQISQEKLDSPPEDQKQLAQNQEKQDGQNPGENPPEGPKSPKDDKQNGDQNGKSESPDNSALAKIRDAVKDLLSKMKPQSKEKGSPPDKGPQNPAQAQQNQDPQEGSGQDSDNAQTSPAASEQKSSGDKQKPDQKQGIGSQDGEKDIRQAEALRAMGKISELLGKRADNVKGAVMIEVGQTKQELKTPLAQQAANHVSAGGEIHRDEVPAEYQQFVQRYFEEVRKTAPASKK